MKQFITFLLLIAFVAVNAQKTRNFNVFKENKIESNNDKIALVIANSDYDIGKLDKPVEEAEYLIKALEKQGYDVQIGYNLDQANMKKAIIEFSKKFNSYKSGMVYYAGHGFQIDGENYLVPTDTPQTDVMFELKSSLVNVDYVFEAINDPKKPKIIILDACRNNPFKDKLASSYRGLEDNGFSEIKAQINSEILFSTAAGTKVNDNNPFTRIFSEEIIVGGCYDDILRRTNTRVRKENPRQILATMGFLEDKICFGEEKKEEPVIPVVVNNNSNQKISTSKTTDDNAGELEDALAWLKGKISGIVYYKYYSTGALSKNFYRESKYKIEYDTDKCEMTIFEDDSYVEDRTSARNDRVSNITYSFNLSDISTIELDEDSYNGKNFKIKTYNNNKAIHKVSAGWASQTINLDEFSIKFTNLGDLEDQPERFIKAFNDAVKMCGGGKKEKY